jgi:hypothetical protein
LDAWQVLDIQKDPFPKSPKGYGHLIFPSSKFLGF